MPEQVSWKIGGQQGEGIESAGELLAQGLKQSGFHLYAIGYFHRGFVADIPITICVSVANRPPLLPTELIC